MGIQNFPAQLQPIIQQGYLEHAFEEALRAKLAYRAVADREPFEGQIGETKTKTRTGLRPPATTPLVPANNTNFDNGMTPSVPGVEQYTMTLNAYGETVDLNVVTQKVGIANQFIMNARQLAEQAARTLDTLAVNVLLNTYLGGNTRVRATLGSAGTTISVDDIRGFQNVFTSTWRAGRGVRIEHPDGVDQRYCLYNDRCHSGRYERFDRSGWDLRHLDHLDQRIGRERHRG